MPKQTRPLWGRVLLFGKAETVRPPSREGFSFQQAENRLGFGPLHKILCHRTSYPDLYLCGTIGSGFLWVQNIFWKQFHIFIESSRDLVYDND